MNILLTGATGAIGRATAIKLASEGHSLYLTCAHRKEELEDLIIHIRNNYGTKCYGSICNLADEASVENLFNVMNDTEAVGDGDGFQPEALVHIAGVSYVGLVHGMSLDEWNEVMNTNLTSAFLLTRALIPHLLVKKTGKLLFVSSVWGSCGASMEVAYSTSKGGLDAFVKAVAKELAPSNIQVNAVAPGFVDTPMNDHLSAEEKLVIKDEIPAGRFASAVETADFISDVLGINSYMTGQVITYDGGWT